MTCVEHDWFFLSPCPRCASTNEPAPVTAAVIVEPGADGAETSQKLIPCEIDDPLLDIPEFLQRNPDNTFKFPGEPRPPTSGKLFTCESAAAPVVPDYPLDQMPICSDAVVARYKAVQKPKCNFGRGCIACWAKYNAVKFGGQGMSTLVKEHAVKQRGKRR